MSEGFSQFGAFTSANARKALEFLREGGTLLVTSGLRDLRLVVLGDRVRLESVGHAPVEDADDDERRLLIRKFLCSLFWEDPTFLVESAAASASRSARVVEVVGSPASVLEEVGQGLLELGELWERVPGVETLVSVRGEPPPPEVDTPSANLFRVLEGTPRGGMLSAAAEQSGLDPIDAAWAVDELLEVEQAAVKKAPLPMVLRRLRKVEQQVELGFSPALRYAHLAFGFAKSDPKRASHYHRLAADAFTRAERWAQAISNYDACLALMPDDLVAKEGLVRALMISGAPSDQTQALQLELAGIYIKWGFPARARVHLEALEDPTPERRNLLLQCMLRMGDAEAATDLAVRLVPQLNDEDRLELPNRFALAGVRGRHLETVVSASGLRRLRPLKRLLYVFAVLTLLLAGVCVGELFVRRAYRQAAERGLEALKERDFEGAKAAWGPLREWSRRLGAQGWPLTRLGRVESVLEEIEALRRDAKRYDAHRGLFQWQGAESTLTVERGLEDLKAQAETEVLVQRVGAVEVELEVYHAEVQEALADLESKVLATNNLLPALLAAKEVLESHRAAKHLFEDMGIKVRLRVQPQDAQVTYEGGADMVKRVTIGEWELTLPLLASLDLTVDAPSHASQSMTLDVETLSVAVLRVDLLPCYPTSTPQWPELEDAEPGVVVVDRARRVESSMRQQNLSLIVESTAPALADLRRLLLPDWRLVVSLESDYKRGRVYLTAVEVFLEDLAGGTKADPYRIAHRSRDLGERTLDVNPGSSEVTLRSAQTMDEWSVIEGAVREAARLASQEFAR